MARQNRKSCIPSCTNLLTKMIMRTVPADPGRSPANSNHQRDGNEGFVLSDPSQSLLNSMYVKQHSYELLFYNVELRLDGILFHAENVTA